MRDAILRERLGDLLTDEFRAMLLRIAGYKVDVIEFTALEHSARNLLIRARKLSDTSNSDALKSEYESMKTAFGVTPYLESLLA
jgi:hypothetical protein